MYSGPYITFDSKLQSTLPGSCRYLVDGDAWYVPALSLLARLVLKTPAQGAETSIYLAR